ncbi:MAG: sn-glycerol-3-phosphate ABC transporter ATP-binding protein UgpC, partial [Candidatus Cloacimonadota bacterium]|nr:sn-glycerol-3-phosphate ABC transporter ATP-binding protein UgpC [Candidatus Cloacimonadota bacterium]
MAKVIVDRINKIYDGDVHAVKNANFVAEDKEFVILVGPSGCGKTTTLRMIAGLETITNGTITIDDKVVNDVLPKDRDIAMVFQNYALYPHMTVYQNMAFALKLRKTSKTEIAEKVNYTANLLGITDLLERKPKQLSGGQRQRVALGRAIVRNPKVFLFDEPLSNLDAKLRVQMRAEITKLHRKLNSTIVYVTHDQVEAMTMGDKIVVMNDGIIQQVDSPLNVYNNPNNLFVASFIGSPSINQINGKLRKSDKNIEFFTADFSLTLTEKQSQKMKKYIDKEVIFGIRPEDIYDARFHSMAEFTQNIDA